jgi:hypothetical protein
MTARVVVLILFPCTMEVTSLGNQSISLFLNNLQTRRRRVPVDHRAQNKLCHYCRPHFIGWFLDIKIRKTKKVHIITCRSDYRRVLDWVTGFIDILYTQFGTIGNTALSLIYTLLEFTVTHTH